MSQPDRRPVLLIRPDGNERDARALDDHGIASATDPYLVTRPCDDPMPAHRFVGLLAAAGPQTALIITSPRTWGHLESVAGRGPLERALSSALDQRIRVLVTGRPARAAGGAGRDRAERGGPRRTAQRHRPAPAARPAGARRRPGGPPARQRDRPRRAARGPARRGLARPPAARLHHRRAPRAAGQRRAPGPRRLLRRPAALLERGPGPGRVRRAGRRARRHPRPRRRPHDERHRPRAGPRRRRVHGHRPDGPGRRGGRRPRRARPERRGR